MVPVSLVEKNFNLVQKLLKRELPVPVPISKMTELRELLAALGNRCARVHFSVESVSGRKSMEKMILELPAGDPAVAIEIQRAWVFSSLTEGDERFSRRSW